MEKEEHEVYRGEIPDEGKDIDPHNVDVKMSTADDDAIKGLDEIKKRLKEMEEETTILREMQAKVEKEMGAVQGLFLFSCDFFYSVFNLKSCSKVSSYNE
ncbi:polyadenylate-binding 2 [Olea europaea subsp. europaea]|uniref:Polyadenylate-binding 2 n=1 Tax=Olea europaea subsp. europaea TaxID=158383 RepID=A0A8S0UJJ6_OLEEU|nr:polyadenylate-binding 2 [Olea europaea subsp. europaea]